MEKIQKRKCVGCGELKSRTELIKITKEHSTEDIIIEPNSKTFGRSAYLCYNQECIDMAFKKSKINKVLKTNKNIDKALIEEYICSKTKGLS